MVLLFFKVFSQTSYRALFPLRLRNLQDMVFERFNSIFWRRKSSTTHFLSWCAAMKRSHWTMIPLLLFVFRIWPKILDKQIVVYHSELSVLWCSSASVATWPVLSRKPAIICFEVIFPQTTFVAFGSGSKTHTVDCPEAEENPTDY